MSVYFIAGPDNSVKIGKADDPVARLQTLQASMPWPLVLLATIPGGYVEETILHRHFAGSRLAGGEWFARTPALDAFIIKAQQEPLAREPWFARAVTEHRNRRRSDDGSDGSHSRAIARRVRALRAQRGLTQAELSELSHLPRATCAKLESGRSNPTVRVLIRIADALVCSVDELLGRNVA